MLARKSQIQNHKQSGVSFTMEKSRLIQARTLALRRNDRAEVENIDVQLRELAGRAAVHNGQTGPEDEPDDILAKVNERNRKANMEAVRKAELLEAERKRKERKLARSGAGTPVPADPSARLRTVPRMYASRFVIAYSRSFRNAHGFSLCEQKHPQAKHTSCKRNAFPWCPSSHFGLCVSSTSLYSIERRERI